MISKELLKLLIEISRRSFLCKSRAEDLLSSIEELVPIIEEIQVIGVELSSFRQSQLHRLSETLQEGIELAHKVLATGRWNVYKLARKMEKLEKKVSRFNTALPAHILADVHHLRADSTEWFERLDGSVRRLEQLAAWEGGIGGGEEGGGGEV